MYCTLTDKDRVFLSYPDSSEGEDEVNSEPQITAGQALDNIYTLRRFLYAQDNLSDEILQSLEKLHTFADINKIKNCTQQVLINISKIINSKIQLFRSVDMVPELRI